MKKTISIIITIILITLLLTGCWDRREVTDLAIAVALGIDKTENGDFKVSIQILNPAENAKNSGGSGYDTPVTTYTMTGKILFEALRKLVKETPRKVYLSHLRIIVISEDVAKDGLNDVLDFFARDHEVRTDFYVVVANQSTANETLTVLTSIEKIPANKLFFSLKQSSEVWTETKKVQLFQLVSDVISDGIEPTLTGVSIKGNSEAGSNTENVVSIVPESVLYYNGIAAFRNNKLIGWLDEESSKGLNYIKNNVSNTVIIVKKNKKNIGIELLYAKSEIVPHFHNGIPSIEVNITGEGNVGEVNNNLDMQKLSVLPELEKKTNEAIKEVVYKVIDEAQNELNADIFGFGQKVHKANPKEWDKLKGKWPTIFSKVPVHVNVDIKLRREGTITNSIYDEHIKE